MMPLAELHQFAQWQRPATQPVCWQGLGQEKRLHTDADLRRRVQQLAAVLSQASEQRWLLWCEDSFEFLIGLLALWQCGHCAVLPANALPETLAQAGVGCNGILSDVLQDAVSTQAAAVTTQAAAITVQQALLPDAIALQLFTSGTTGTPKLVTRTLRQLQAELQALQQQFSLPAGTVLATVPHHHIYGLLFRLLWPLAGMRPFVSAPEHYPEPLLSQIDVHAPVVLISSPAHLERLPAAVDLSRVAHQCHAVFSSGAPLSREAALSLQHALGAAPFEVLGSTETGGVAWRQRDVSSTDESWQLLPGVQLRLDAESVLEVLSPAAEKQEWCRLGDRGQLIDDNRFRLLGRADRVAKIEGQRVSLTELEQRLQAHPFVQEVAALILDGFRSSVAVVVQLSAAGEAELQQQGKLRLNTVLCQHLAQRFDRVALPKRFRYVASLPRDDRGKLTQLMLRTLFDEETAP